MRAEGLLSDHYSGTKNDPFFETKLGFREYVVAALQIYGSFFVSKWNFNGSFFIWGSGN